MPVSAADLLRSLIALMCNGARAVQDCMALRQQNCHALVQSLL